MGGVTAGLGEWMPWMGNYENALCECGLYWFWKCGGRLPSSHEYIFQQTTHRGRAISMLILHVIHSCCIASVPPTMHEKKYYEFLHLYFVFLCGVLDPFSIFTEIQQIETVFLADI